MTKFQKIIIGIFLAVSIIGFVDALYLTIEHFRGVVPPCSILKGCEVVTTSSYSVVFGIPVALLGALYYVFFFIFSLAYFDSKKERILSLLSRFSIFGFLASLYFVYLQFFVLKALCIYCMMSATTSTLLFIVGMFYLFRKNSTDQLIN